MFAVIRRAPREAGVGVIYISHRLEEVFRIADRVTVLKDGSGQGTSPVRRGDIPRTWSRGWSGAVSILTGRRQATPPAGSPVVLEVRGLSDAGHAPGPGRDSGTSRFEVRCGEIVGLAGLVGAGRTELALGDLRRPSRGDAAKSASWAGESTPRSPAEAIAAGIGYLSEDRKETGLFLEMSIADNILAVDRRHRRRVVA